MTAIKWTLLDKLVLSSILPKEGTLHSKTLCRDIRKKTALTADEIKESELESKDDKLVFKNNIEVDLEFTKDEISLLKKEAKFINAEEKVTDDNLSIIEKLLA